jgi:hypothetical protein
MVITPIVTSNLALFIWNIIRELMQEPLLYRVLIPPQQLSSPIWHLFKIPLPQQVLQSEA